MIGGPDRATIAGALSYAAAAGTPVDPPSAVFAGFDVEDAYAVQELVVGRRLDLGARRVGWKVGLTSAAMQEQLGVDEPDYGPLLDAMEIVEGGTLDTSRLIAPRVEAELALSLAADLPAPVVTVEDVRAAVGTVQLALEVIDSRVRDWRLTLPDTIADHASCSNFVLGKAVVPIGDLDLARVAISVLRDGVEAGRGEGSAVLGDPLRALAWTANTLNRHGVSIGAGDVVMTGALHAAIPLAGGSLFEARSADAGLGAVSLRVAAPPEAAS